MQGLILKIARVRAGLTLWELGEPAGVHTERISETECGQRAITEAVVAALNEVSDAVFKMKKGEDLSA